MCSLRIIRNDTSSVARGKADDRATRRAGSTKLAPLDAGQHDDGLLDLLARIDAPESLLRHPAIETATENAAPRSGAGLHRAEHSDLQPGDHLGACHRHRLQ